MTQEEVGHGVDVIAVLGSEPLWRVCWRYKDGRKSGHGEPISKKTANAAVISGNANFPGINHWAILA